MDACGQLGPGVRNDASGSGRWKTPGMTYGWCHRDIKRTWTFIQSSKWALLAGLRGWEAEQSVPGRASRTMERTRGVACERRRAGRERGGSIRGECGGESACGAGQQGTGSGKTRGERGGQQPWRNGLKGGENDPISTVPNQQARPGPGASSHAPTRGFLAQRRCTCPAIKSRADPSATTPKLIYSPFFCLSRQSRAPALPALEQPSALHSAL